MVSRACSRLSQASTQSRLEIDELESLIREKCRSQFRAVQKMFTDNDPQRKGNVNRCLQVPIRLRTIMNIICMMTFTGVYVGDYLHAMHLFSRDSLSTHSSLLSGSLILRYSGP